MSTLIPSLAATALALATATSAHAADLPQP